jgi:hypothetical protein
MTSGAQTDHQTEENEIRGKEEAIFRPGDGGMRRRVT